MVSIRIIAWSDDHAWTTFLAYPSHDLERRLLHLTGWTRGDVKRLVRRLKNRECLTLPLPGATDANAAEPLRSLLESVGAWADIEDGGST
jgi:hypothetical protein